MQAKATFEVKSWDEHTVNEVDGRLKITRAAVVFGYTGDLQGESAMEYLMAYGDDGSAEVIGLERFTGTLAGKTGTFVVRSFGSYADGVARGELEVVAGSATGQLAGITGRGESVATKEGNTTLTLDYEIGN